MAKEVHFPREAKEVLDLFVGCESVVLLSSLLGESKLMDRVHVLLHREFNIPILVLRYVQTIEDQGSALRKLTDLKALRD